MKKILLATSFIGMLLLFNGCGEDSDAVDILENQQMLDEQDYEGVVDKLGSIDDGDLTDSEVMALGAAYMGKSGVGLSDIIEIMLDSSSEDNSSEDDGFAKFADSIAEKKSDTALSDLKTSTHYYEMVVGSCDDNTTLTNSQKDVCLNIGLASSVMAVVTIGYLGDVGSLLAGFDTSTGDNDQMDASTCAMQYAIDDNVTKQTNLGCVATIASDVTFLESQKTYTPLTIKMVDTNNSYDYLLTAPVANLRQTTVTNGYCELATFDSRDETMTYDINNSLNGFYICPVGESPDAEELTTETMIVEALNGGFDSVIAAAGGEDSDLAASIEEFKLEINSDSNGSEDTEITMEDIIAYLNSQE